ncbi:acyl carrier protein, partial [Streptomyces sp. SID11385]|uniref:acyl carrier protein n=1 Tax=Streptomyces sp. SID11385 TaxID=2706031 RepID=UPI0013CC2B64
GRRGLPLLRGGPAVAAFARALDFPEPGLVLADIDWERFVRVFGGDRPDPLFLEIPEVRRLRATAGTREQSGAAVAARLSAAEPSQRREVLLGLLRSEVAAILGHADADAVSPRREFLELGMDSVTTLALRNRLQAATGLQLSARDIWDLRSPDALARHLAARFGDAQAAPAQDTA